MVKPWVVLAGLACLVLLASCAQAVPVPVPAIDISWAFNPSPNTFTATCGQKVRIHWTNTPPPHNLRLLITDTVPTKAEACSTSNTLILGNANSGDFTYTFGANGVYSFACTVGTHCTAQNMLVTITVTDCPPICFPETSTVRRVSSTGSLETVSLPQLRIGDNVECLSREPVIRADGSVTSAVRGELTTCQVYDYKKAVSTIQSEYTFITYDRPEGARPGLLVASPTHHVLNPKTGQAAVASSLSAEDELLVLEDGALTTAHVLGVKMASAKGAFVPLLTKGGLPIVDGAVAYPSSGESDVGLDAKFWGQYFLSAPIWQALEKQQQQPADNAAVAGKSLAELGARPGMEVGAFTQKFYAVAVAAAKEGRTFKDWAGVAAEMRAAIAGGKVYSVDEALAVYDRHIKAPAGLQDVTVA